MSFKSFHRFNNLLSIKTLLIAYIFLSSIAFCSKLCKSCKISYEDQLQFCPYCGKKLVMDNKSTDAKYNVLSIETIPEDAQIIVNGNIVATGPKYALELSKASYTIQIKHQDYSPIKLHIDSAKKCDLSIKIELFKIAQTEAKSDVINLPINKSSGNQESESSYYKYIKSIADKYNKEMVLVPAGTYVLGSEKGNPDERPLRRIETNSFYIDKYEVTCAQYYLFLEDVKKHGHKWCHRTEPPNKDHTPYHTYAWALRFSWLGGKPPNGLEEHPVVLVDWYDAYAYANWAGKRLPTENEWEIAAGGGRGIEYPWGNNFDMQFCNIGNYPVKVGMFPLGASPWGVLDMAGNVAEWTASMYEPDPKDSKLFTGRFGQPIIKGGSWDDEAKSCRIANRNVYRSPLYRSTTVGFRCVSNTAPK